MIESAEATAGAITIWLQPVGILLVAVLAGLFVELIVMTWLKGLAQKTDWTGDDLLLRALRGMPTLWFVLIGIYQAWFYVIETGSLVTVSGTSLRLLEQGLVVIVIISGTVIVVRLISEVIDASGGAGVTATGIPSFSILKNVLRVVALSISILIILQYVGISVTPALAALGVTGLAVSLALQETLSNLFSGVLIVASNQIRPGHYVRLNSGEEGYVSDITWRTTNIRQLSNNLVVVPNAAMTSAIVLNYEHPEPEMSILFEVGVSYESDLEHVEQVTIDVCKETLREVAGGVPDFEPFIRYHTFNDFSIQFTVILRGQDFVSQYLIKHEFVKRLHKRYREEGIVIPFPIRTLHTPGTEHLQIVQESQQNGQAQPDAAPTSAKRGDSGAA
jgi:small-conductance mechanosensitive channel